MTLSQIAICDDSQTVHDTAHFGASYAITMFGYGFYTKVFRMEPIPAFIFSAVLTTCIGYSYKAMTKDSPSSYGRSMLYNTYGILGAGATITVFKF